MKRQLLIFLAYVLLIGSYVGFNYYQSRPVDTGSSPKITVPDGVLEVKVKDKQKKILKDVVAIDKEDGVLSDQVFIENISAFGEGDIRQVTLGVFDSQDNYSTAIRSIHYKNYKAPVIGLKKALVYNWVSSKATFADYVYVYSSVDGDISASATVNREYTQNKNHYVEFSVTDSTGTTSVQTFKALKSDKDINIDIQLKKYVKYIKKGESVDARKNIEAIVLRNMDYSDLKSEVDIKTDFVANKKGMYEYIYTLKTKNDDYGLTKLVVVVQ